ncbi:FliI/YscN family ATPase [Dermatophilus congolensis]|uniref:FliI/YscN family ATPase n=1 Tax=Dermatophilus congolensis TaxID=1863 RepID=UPI001AAF0F38|nr:FliI/YscN family ATPase [Dermatophilus congolensis]MBO3129997.1 FliI/YscN family ATPase [Dermatophilus congolensis]MBO3131373.1 FliI/YscN family ATPase [Dermatophilus congolensis]MBO3134471.1 FliI/YscN family ATPase [Dermatophilus congolensis]MBO3136706.1 FliI/YscN family ATPase [Dermatophilus congolensis]MBO3138951.1 FliI/YscN family ATPase [Dermatophilus congolensis]
MRAQMLRATAPVAHGTVVSAVGLSIDVAGLQLAVGEAVRILGDDGPIIAEVVALHEGYASCMPISDLRGVRAGNPAIATGGALEVPVGMGMLGRVVDALGRPMDGGPALSDVTLVITEGSPPPAMDRERIGTPMPLGVRAMDTLIPCGKGQRLGIFAGSGVGKSSLLSMIVRGSSAPVCVLALVGERGREVREFVEGDLGPEGLARSVVVVATSDEPALVRLRAASTATRIAEWFRDQGQDVILCMDSVTRVAMAQREVGLASGEPPATRGYPPSVFGIMPKLLERAGMAATGSITGLYTVLVDGDDLNDPIADNVRSILDGHIVLSRKLATQGHFPAIDVLESISRANKALTTREQREAATTIRKLMAAQRDAKDLIDIGAYVKGTNPLVDKALELAPEISSFLIQDMEDLTPYEQSWAQLSAIAAR